MFYFLSIFEKYFGIFEFSKIFDWLADYLARRLGLGEKKSDKLSSRDKPGVLRLPEKIHITNFEKIMNFRSWRRLSLAVD